VNGLFTPRAAHVPAARHQYVFDAAAEPALVVEPGATIVIETLDCFSNRLGAGAPTLRDENDILDYIGGRYNPVNAPIFVEGAEPGDRLAVDIVDIALGRRERYAVTHVAHDWAAGFGGAAFADAAAPVLTIAEIEGESVHLRIGGTTRICRAQPMIGTIGTAPAGRALSSLLYGAGHGGNLDCPHVRPGATMLLPVNVLGGLLSLGDVHALMGEGELTGTALETSADVTVRIRLERHPDRPLPAPRISDGEGLGVLGCVSRTSLEDNVAAAMHDLVMLLRDEIGIASAEALQLVNLFGRIVVNQAVGSGAERWLSVLARMSWADLELFAPQAAAMRP